jgi:glutamate 5-kinase
VTVVVKLGSTLIVGPGGRVRRSVLRERAREVAQIVGGGESVCIVTSGAIGLGLPRLGLARRPREVPLLQAASALGQARLQQAWDAAFAPHRILTAQVLLTAADVADRASYLHARNAFTALFEHGAVPIVNENDTTATDEITFGDNDALAAQVAVLVKARLLILLTEVDGVYTRAPGLPGAELVADGTAALEAEIGEGSRLGTGGMGSKIVAAQMAASGGIPTVIAGGLAKDVLVPIVAGEQRGTRFRADDRGLSAFKLWLRFGKPTSGRLTVDAGARKALVEGGASLLAVGVTAVDGRFEAGDAVELAGPDGVPFAKGIAGADAREIAGRQRGVEAVHRDRLVLLA